MTPWDKRQKARELEQEGYSDWPDHNMEKLLEAERLRREAAEDELHEEHVRQRRIANAERVLEEERARRR